MTEIEKLVLQVESQGATATQQQVDKLDSSVRKASTSFGGLKAASLAYYGAAVAIAAVVYKVGKALVDATVEYQDFNAQLVTATGSSANATKAYGALVDFAAKTPYSLSQAISSFIKLTNSGLNPSERALYSYGNTASATGHRLDEMVYAVNDAVQGIDKPLEQFSIKAIRQAGNVIFSFRGVTTQVKDNAKAIQDYLIGIGEKNFPTAMAERMKTLGGILSNVADSWHVLLTTITQQGPDTFFGKTFSSIGDNLDKLNAQLKSGELQATILAYWNSWKWMWDNLNESITSATGWIETGVNKWSKLFGGTDIDLKDIFSYKFPSYVKEGLELAFTDILEWNNKVEAMWAKWDAKRDKFYSDVAKNANSLITSVNNYIDPPTSLHNRMAGLAKPGTVTGAHPMGGGDQEEAIYGAAADAYAKTAAASKQTAQQQLSDAALVAMAVEEDYADFIKASSNAATKQQTDATATKDLIFAKVGDVLNLHKQAADQQDTQVDFSTANVITSVAQQAQADTTATTTAVANASKRVQANTQIKESYDATSSNILFGIGEQVNAETDATKKALDDAKAQGAAWKATNAAKAATSGDRLAPFQVIAAPSKTPQQLAADAALEKQLLSQNLKDLEANITTEGQVIGAGYEAQKETILSNTATTEQEKKDLIIKALQGSLTDEMTALTEGYDKRREFILSDTALTENAKTDLMKRLTASREAAVMQLELKTQKVRLDQASEFFGNIASIGSTFGEKGFKIAKAAAIAQATIKTYEAATAAYAALAGIPYIGPALGIAAAGAAIVAGVANIAQIKAQQYTPAYEHGGMIPAGKYGLVGEAGAEIVRGPGFTSPVSTSASESAQGQFRVIDKATVIKGPAIVTSAASTRAFYSNSVRNSATNITTNKTATSAARDYESQARDRKTPLAGFYAQGGMIPGGAYGLVGEQGPEIVKGPAIVTSAASTRNRPQEQGNVVIHNHGAPVTATTERDQNGDLLVILKPLLDENRRKTKTEITQEIHRGGSPMTTALETKYQLNRKGV